MIKIGELMSIKTLHKQGISDRQIAKLLRISRNTVTKYIETDESPQYHRTEPYRSILDGLLGEEVRRRDEGALDRKLKGASFPTMKMLGDFDFNFQPWIARW